MFVRQSTYDAKCTELMRLKADHYILLNQWNALVRRINDRGGEKFFAGDEKKNSQFTSDELTKLINLCHPDKHDGKPMATEMTSKLLLLKGK